MNILMIYVISVQGMMLQYHWETDYVLVVRTMRIDAAQFAELDTMGELVERAWAKNCTGFY